MDERRRNPARERQRHLQLRTDYLDVDRDQSREPRVQQQALAHRRELGHHAPRRHADPACKRQLNSDNDTAFSGTAGAAAGDSATVTVTVYSGTSASGTPVETLAAQRQPDNSYSVTASPALIPGTYTAQAQQTDAAGNTGLSSANSFTVDTTPPLVTLTQPPSGSTSTSATPTFSGTAGNAAGDSATISVAVYTGASASGTPIETLSAQRQADNAYSVTASPELLAGTYTAQAQQTDAAANTGLSSANTFTVDTTAPLVTLTQPANGSSTRNVTPAFAGTAGSATADSATVTVYVYAGTSASGTAIEALSAIRQADNSYSVTASPALAPGTYTAQARQTNDAGNTGLSSANTFTVDTTAPVVSLTRPGNGTSTTTAAPMFAGTAGSATGDSATLSVGVYTGTSASGTPVETLSAQRQTDNSYSVTASPALTPGTYTARAQQTDAAGNTGLSSANTFTVSAPAPPPDGTCGFKSRPPAVYAHVIVIMMENKNYSDIVGNSLGAPYENQLASACGLATNYFGVAHPSLPNYIAATSGSTQGITDDAGPAAHPLAAPSIFSQVASWRGYAESMPFNCDLGDAYPYKAYHTPAPYYTSVASACPSWDVPLGTTSSGAFLDDLGNDTLPSFAFITPNMCDDTHDCSIASGDAWLQAWIPKIVASPAYQAGNTVVFVTWDEDDNYTDNHVATIVLSPYTPAGTQSGLRFDHYSLLRTTEELLGLNSYLGNAATAPSMRSAFGLIAGPAVTLTQPRNGSSTASTTPTFAGTAGSADGDSATVTVNVYPGASASGTPVETLSATRQADNSYSVTAAPALATGTYTAQAQQTDAAGNIGLSAANAFTVDTTAPLVTLAQPANGSSTSTGTPAFTGTAGSASGDSAAVTVNVYAGTSPFGTPLETLSAQRQADNSYTVTASPALASGTYTAQTQQTDAAGNTGLSSANTFTVNATAGPGSSIIRGQKSTPVSVGSGTTATTTWTKNPAAGSTILVFVQTAATITSVVDNGATPTTFTQDAVGTGGKRAYVFRANGITLPSSGAYAVKVTTAAAATIQVIGIEYSGLLPGAPEATNAGGGTSNAVTTGSVTGSAGDLYFGGFSDNSGQNPESIAFNSGPTFTEQWRQTNGSAYWPAALADAIVPAGGLQSISWTLGDSPSWGAVIAAYKAGP